MGAFILGLQRACVDSALGLGGNQREAVDLAVVLPGDELEERSADEEEDGVLASAVDEVGEVAAKVDLVGGVGGLEPSGGLEDGLA